MSLVHESGKVGRRVIKFLYLKECTTFKTSGINNPVTQRNDTKDLNPQDTGN